MKLAWPWRSSAANAAGPAQATAVGTNSPEKDQEPTDMNVDVLLDWGRLRLGKQSRFNPIRTLTPESLASNLDQFDYGYLRWAALTWDKMEKRDDVLKSVAGKRKKAPGRRPWKIMTRDDSAEAQRQKKTLEYFYTNLRVTDGTDRNRRGRVRMLITQSMDCVSKYYAVHHIVWQPSPEGLTAELFFIPLWYFENLTGELRFLPQDFATEGAPLAPGEWLVVAGDGLMEACSIGYIFKNWPLQDWLFYSQKFGLPGVIGKTDAAPGTPIWRKMVEAVASWGKNFSAVVSKADTIEKLDMGTQGQLPQPALVERMDRAFSALYRGADLSSMSGTGGSKGGGQGASLQGEESELLEGDDCEMISEAFQDQLDKYVIFYQHGTTEQLAYFTIESPSDQDVDQDLKIDQFLWDVGFPIALQDVADRYDRRIPADSEELLQAPTQPEQVQMNEGGDAGNSGIFSQDGLAKLITSIKRNLTAANAPAWRPLVRRLEALEAAPDGAYFELLEKLPADLPALLAPTGADDAAIAAWNDAISTCLVNGLAQHQP